MNEKKTDKLHYVYSNNTIDSIFLGICTLFSCILTLLVYIEDGDETSVWLYLFLIIISLTGIWTTFRRIVTDYKFVFDIDGFAIIERNRINTKEDKKLYLWDDIQNIRFKTTGIRSPRLFLIIKYKRTFKEDEIQVSSFFQPSKFTKLARQYSGRDNIIKEKKKRKPYEKDW